jgi:hypothetical protein
MVEGGVEIHGPGLGGGEPGDLLEHVLAARQPPNVGILLSFFRTKQFQNFNEMSSLQIVTKFIFIK